jgi:hypothetical protein
MMRILFFFMGVPMIFMSFFQAVDALPYATEFALYQNGHEIQLSVQQCETLKQQVEKIFENSQTLPSHDVASKEDFAESFSEGTYVSVKFDQVMHINDMPFDELVFKVERDTSSFNVVRRIHGNVQGRCIYVDLSNENMNELCDFVDNLETSQTTLPSEDEAENVNAPTEEVA